MNQERDPVSVRQLDMEIGKGFHRLRWAMVWALISVLVLSVLALGLFTLTLLNRLEASCTFYGELATAPVPSRPHPSKLGIGILVGSRYAYEGQHCPGHLMAPSSRLRYWANVYHITIR